MMEHTEFWTRNYRGIEIQVWKSGGRWFAFAPGQGCLDKGHRTLSRALEYAEEFVDAQNTCSLGAKSELEENFDQHP
jgi:hypothetical protein